MSNLAGRYSEEARVMEAPQSRQGAMASGLKGKVLSSFESILRLVAGEGFLCLTCSVKSRAKYFGSFKLVSLH